MHTSPQSPRILPTAASLNVHTARAGTGVVDLASNQLPFPPPESVLRAAREADADVHLYPEVTSRSLIERLVRHLQHGVHLEHIRGDRVLQEALAVGADPLHLSLVFGLSHSTASRYADIAREILAGELDEAADER